MALQDIVPSPYPDVPRFQQPSKLRSLIPDQNDPSQQPRVPNSFAPISSAPPSLGRLPNLAPSLPSMPLPSSDPTASMELPNSGPALPSLPNVGGLKSIVTNPQKQHLEHLQDIIARHDNPTKPQGFWQNLRHDLAVAGNIAGDVFAPGTMAMIPGTQLHNELNYEQAVKEKAGIQKQNMDQQSAASENALRGAQTAEAAERTAEMPGEAQQKQDLTDAQIQNLLHPQAKTDFEYWRQQNPNAPVSDWLKLQSRNQKVTPEQQAYNEAFQELTGKGMSPSQAVEKLKEKPPTVNVNAGTAALDRESARFAKPYEAMNTAAGSQIEKIDEARLMVNGNIAGQGLAAAKVLTALVSGQGSGVRITQAELQSFMKARGIAGDAEAFINGITGEGKFSGEQQKQITELLNDVRQRVLEKQQIANDALDKINSRGSREEILAAEKEARQKLSTLERGEGGQQSGGGSGLQVRLSDAMNLPMNKGKSEAEVIKDIEAHRHTVIR